MPPPHSRERLAGLESILWAIDNRVDLQELATASTDEAELIESLKRLHQFDANQCNFVLSLSVSHMTKRRRSQLLVERQRLLDELAAES